MYWATSLVSTLPPRHLNTPLYGYVSIIILQVHIQLVLTNIYHNTTRSTILFIQQFQWTNASENNHSISNTKSPTNYESSFITFFCILLISLKICYLSLILLIIFNIFFIYEIFSDVVFYDFLGLCSDFKVADRKNMEKTGNLINWKTTTKLYI